MRARGLQTRLVAPLAVLLAAIVLVAGCGGSSGRDDDMGGADSAVGSSAQSPGASGPIQLVAPTHGAGKCAVPSAQVLEQATVAFEGTVRSIDDGLVALTVTRWWRGGEAADGATVQAPPGELRKLVGAVDFAEGGRYLVAGTGADLMVCGLSAPYDEQLAALYAEAFGE